MTDYVVDSSIVIQRFIRDTYTEQAQRLFRNLLLSDRFYVAEFCLVECTNVLWKQVRFHSMPEDEAKDLLVRLLRVPLKIEPMDYLLPSALQIGLAHKLAIYDSVYIALAEFYKFPLITADAKQEAAARTVGVTIKPITDF